MSHEIVPGGDWPYIPPRQTGGNKKPWWAGWRGKSPNKTQRRKMMKKCGKKCFLGPNLSFPICAKGTCRKNKRGIMSAYIRAKQWGKPRKFYRNYWGKPHMKRKVYTRVAKKARKLMGWKKGGARRRRRKSRKKRGGGGYEERLFFTTMAGDEFSIALMQPEDDDADTKEDTNEDTQQIDDDSEIARWMTFEQIQKVLFEYLEDLNREAAERGDGGKYTIDRDWTNIHLVFPNRQVAALGSAEWRRHNDFTFDQVLDEAWVDKRILTSRLDPEDPEKRVPYYSELQPGRLIHIFLSQAPGPPCRDLEARAHRRPARAAGAFALPGPWVGGGRRKTKRKRGGVGVWVTVVELKRNFNINDFEVGLIIDMKMSASEDPRTNLEIVMLEDEELIYKFKSEDNPTSRGARFRNIHAVKFPHEYAVEKGFLKKKPPKSATKTSKKRGGRRKTRRKRGGAPHGNFIVGAKVQLTEAGLDYYTTAVEHARYLFGGREQPPDRETAATWRGRINDSRASGWDSDNEDSKGYVQVQWEEQTISWPRRPWTGRMIGYGVERPDDALPHLHPPIDYIKLARRKPPKSAMKKHTAKKKKHTTHPPINYDPPINYAKKGIYLPLTLVGGKRRKTRRRKTRSLQNQ